MKKDHIEEYDYLYTSYPLFSWKQCSKCKKDFRREKIWRALTGRTERFLCMTCASTKKEASKFFINKEFLPYRPDPPPAPPKRRLEKEN